ncbi:AAA family ATPase [Planococcus sp. APC 3906]|uniref:ATP-dependent nuclease n=1 Tax=Planococcus sp. APC 3906 TaxID=3035194 RepID=UPI0025B52B44|nr:AAA family ATPase [Planococcus sp. APC 3906]MDN3451554.1 AAA family ATPase [Planococcus sp. APC 3906]
MYLKNISLTNFRKFNAGKENQPAITIDFNPNFNILVGENDSGKTAVIDAVRYLLGSVSNDYEQIKDEDFYTDSAGTPCDYFYIEGIFVDLSEKEAGTFLEWLSFDEVSSYQLRVSLRVEKKISDNGQEYIDKKTLAGDQAFESSLNSQAKEFLKTTYLKPLRDASNELKPGFRSRLAHILRAHPAFKKNTDSTEHDLVITMQKANEKIEEFFEDEYSHGHSLVKDIENLLKDFHDVADQSKSRSKFSITKTDLFSILKRLSLDSDDVNLGLGNLNILFIAAELLLLNNESVEQLIGPQITLIEEIEAHLHTQAQIRLVKYIEKELEKNKSQYILTSHSSNLVASIDPRHIIMINDGIAYPFVEEFTELDTNDYEFLERFLDATKSNLFFAKGIILVEGESEMLLLPALANLIEYPLHKNGISIVNVSGTSFERYIKLYSRSRLWREEMRRPSIKTPLSIVTDIDVKPWTYYEFEEKRDKVFSIISLEELEKVLIFCEESLEEVISENIGVEYSTLNKLALDFKFKVKKEYVVELEELLKKNITETYIKEKERKKIEILEEKYRDYDSNVKLCIALEWTLEYTLAQSVLAPYLVEAIHEVRYKNPYKGKFLQAYNELIRKLKEPSINPHIAYEIFQPVNDKLVSKAEVAQLLAIKLNDLKAKPLEYQALKEAVLKDRNLEYLINSIKHSASLE